SSSFVNAPASPAIFTLSLHDALPIYVRPMGELGVGHDGRRVRVHEHDLVALRDQYLAGLRPRVVELGRLPDHDRAGADQEDLLRSEEHTSELQSLTNLVCRLLLEKKN